MYMDEMTTDTACCMCVFATANVRMIGINRAWHPELALKCLADSMQLLLLHAGGLNMHAQHRCSRTFVKSGKI